MLVNVKVGVLKRSGPASDDITCSGARGPHGALLCHSAHNSVRQLHGAMAEESRGKRRKQANPRRNRGMM
ncbi:zinc finger E-box-binding homeobox 2 isoform X1 [Tachysurus ichikawai]